VKGLGFILLAGMVTLPFSALAQEPPEYFESANYLMDGCRAVADGTVGTAAADPDNAFRAGMCLGELYTLRQFTLCAPQAVTVGQVAKVVLAYLDRHPEKLHEKFVVLAATALAQTWPCRLKNSN
jgi:hypothetical protein